MAATATKKSELVLDETSRKVYERCWNIADEALKNLGIDAAPLQKIKDPYEFSKAMKQHAVPYDLVEICNKLNHLFTTKNNIPEKTVGDEKVVGFLSDYVEKISGKKFEIAIREARYNTINVFENTLLFPEDLPVLDAFIVLPHELTHLTQTFGGKLNDLDMRSLPMLRKSEYSSTALKYADFTGVPLKEMREELLIQDTYSHMRAAVFLIHLYDIGLYKPKDEKLREDLEFSRFMLDRDMRRAYLRYSEGRAQMGLLELLNTTDDDAVKARAAIELMMDLPFPSPQAVFGESNRDIVVKARENEGFRFQIDLQKKLGKERLNEFEKWCTEKDWMPGIDIHGRLVVIDPKERKMYEVDLEKLRGGAVEIHDIRMPPAVVERDMGRFESMPIADQLEEVHAGEKHTKYMPSREEIKKIARLVEKVTKMKVSENLKEGKGIVKIVNREQAEIIDKGQSYLTLEKFVHDPLLREMLKKRIDDAYLLNQSRPAFFNPANDGVYLIAENFEFLLRNQCEEFGLKPDSPEGRRLERYLILHYFIHEHIHQTVKRNNPRVGDSQEDAMKAQAKLASEYLADALKTPEKEKNMLKAMALITDRMDAMESYDEGVAHYATHKVLCKLGFSKWASWTLRTFREDTKHILHSEGIKFIEAVQIKTSKTNTNPIEFTIGHPPTSMRHIELPDEYLKDREAGKI